MDLNNTNVVLIPKKKSPVEITNLRPISLCNVLVKIITKVMANRMKDYLKDIISETQSAFVPGRLISDNFLISYEVMHYLKRKRRGNEGFMALKLDMAKAYDRIEWSYLRAILIKLGFHEWWVHLVMQCVCSVKYTVVHGTKETGPIIPSRGIRQGDPLSPCLFILCAEGLSALLRKFEAQKLIQGVRICRRAPVISHMLFADDSYVFCKASEIEAANMVSLLRKFELASGQQVNLGKSYIFFSSNVSEAIKREICGVLQMNKADDRSKYLGLPNFLGRGKLSLLGYSKSKVQNRVRCWDGKFISKAGKEVFIKSVAQAMPSYAMSVFLLPLDIIKEIERTLSKY